MAHPVFNSSKLGSYGSKFWEAQDSIAKLNNRTKNFIISQESYPVTFREET